MPCALFIHKLKTKEKARSLFEGQHKDLFLDKDFFLVQARLYTEQAGVVAEAVGELR
ncbi:MAG: hypothetical protein L0229_04440 [Blastocatellia bacterium]|nr:hypothetical protein [Blastocatellia bacterium]